MKRKPSIRDVRAVLVRQNPHCSFCNRLLKDDPQARDDQQPTADHLLALGRGGTEDPENVVLSCRRCNQFKGDLTLPEFRVLLAWMLERLSAMPAA